MVIFWIVLLVIILITVILRYKETSSIYYKPISSLKRLNFYYNPLVKEYRRKPTYNNPSPRYTMREPFRFESSNKPTERIGYIIQQFFKYYQKYPNYLNPVLLKYEETLEACVNSLQEAMALNVHSEQEVHDSIYELLKIFHNDAIRIYTLCNQYEQEIINANVKSALTAIEVEKKILEELKLKQ